MPNIKEKARAYVAQGRNNVFLYIYQVSKSVCVVGY